MLMHKMQGLLYAEELAIVLTVGVSIYREVQLHLMDPASEVLLLPIMAIMLMQGLKH